MADWVVWLDQVSREDVPLVGGKGANLGEMIRAGLPVPRAYAITAAAYRRQLDGSSIGTRLGQLLAERTGQDDALSTAIKVLFETSPLLAEIDEEIRQAYRELGSSSRVAVRSSATAEDLPEASFAGQHETFLGVSMGRG